MPPTSIHDPSSPDAAGLSFSRTVDRTLLHRRNLTDVFLTDIRRTGERHFVAAALLPVVHPHYTSHAGPAGQITDPMLLLECCRQAETYAAHAFHGVEVGAAFILRSWSAEFAAEASSGHVGPTELVITAETGSPRLIGGAVRGLDYEFSLWVSGTWIARVRMDVMYAPREAYLAIRSRERGGPPPSSDRQPSVPTGLPIAASRVGRISATDTLLLNVAVHPDTVTATLRVPVENPSFFDHVQDHVPAMVMVEAARQIAALAVNECGGGPPHSTTMAAMDSSFTAYAELDKVVIMTARAEADPASADRRHIEVTFQQDGKETSRTAVLMTAISATESQHRRPRADDRAALVAGLGTCLPPTVVANDELASSLDVDDTWIRTRTGIHERHMVTCGEATGDLAVEAGRRAMKSAGIAEVDAVILATSTPDLQLPATAPEVASRLGLGNVPAFDVAAACTGFLYVLASGAGLIAAGIADTVLVIGADTFSTILNPADPTTRVIFGDGAGAVVLRAGSHGEHGALSGMNLGSDGSHSGLITVPGSGSRHRSAASPAQERDGYLLMEGRAVFAEAVRRMSASVSKTAAEMGWPLEKVDRFVLHQANARILTSIAERIGVPPGRFLSNIDRVGNTAAASIPLALADGVIAGELSPGQRVILSGFGGGLTWGSVGLIWPRLSPG
jgi:3-oxoacyl-[acyl-carrier-protein] synthase III